MDLVDAHNNREICRYVQGADTAVLHGLLDEALAAATDRSLEPVLLDAPVLAKILSAAQENIA